jgi:hypothetical protein
VPQQLVQRLADRRIGVAVEDHPPAGLRQVARIEPRHHGPPPRLERPPLKDLDDLLRRHRRHKVLAGGSVDAVEDAEIAACSISLHGLLLPFQLLEDGTV